MGTETTGFVHVKGLDERIREAEEKDRRSAKMSEYTIKDYWCYGCGLVCNTSFVCPVCSSINYGVITLDLSKDPKRDLLMDLYNKGTLYVHRENGKLALKDRSIGKVEAIAKAENKDET